MEAINPDTGHVIPIDASEYSTGNYLDLVYYLSKNNIFPCEGDQSIFPDNPYIVDINGKNLEFYEFYRLLGSYKKGFLFHTFNEDKIFYMVGYKTPKAEDKSERREYYRKGILNISWIAYIINNDIITLFCDKIEVHIDKSGQIILYVYNQNNLVTFLKFKCYESKSHKYRNFKGELI